ncbi:MAG: FecR domain-containing protein [Spirochaetales bacterium]|nr:FecR domain-containing protein [Spirochaetales bacterium]
MKTNQSSQNIYSRLKRFTPLRLVNTPHKNKLRRILEKEFVQEAPVHKQPVPWLRYAIPAFAVVLIIIIINLAFILPAFFSRTDLARLYRTYDQVQQQENDYVFDENQGVPLNPGTVYKTSGSETRLIVFKDKTTVQIFTNTEFLLTELKRTETCLVSSLYLRHGILECNSQHAAVQPCFSVITDCAKLEIIGTHLKVQVDRDKRLHVEVYKGRIRINHLHSALAAVKNAGLSEAEKHDLEALLLASVVTLHQGQMYTTYYDEISRFQERINFLIADYEDSGDQKAKTARFKEIETEVKSMQNKLQKSISATDEQSTALVLSGQEGMEAGLDTNVAVSQQAKPASSGYYLLSTLEADDTYKSSWNFSGPEEFFSLSSEHAFNGSHALKIALPDPTSEIFAWHLTLTKNLPVNNKLSLKIRVKTHMLQGQGAALAVRADETVFPSNRILLYNTTRDQIVITGSSDWQEYTLALKGKIPANTKSISIYLLYLPRTTGSVYFDDIRLKLD